MAENKKGQLPALPVQFLFGDGSSEIYYGVTKRYHTACIAMQGLLSNINYTTNIALMEGKDIWTELVSDAYVLADELLKQENKEN